MPSSSFATNEPSPEDLAAIEAEMPLIEAEMALVDAEVRIATAPGGPSPLDWQRLDHARARVARVAAELAARPGVDLATHYRAVA